MRLLLVSLWIRDMCNHVTDQWVTSLTRLVIIVMCVSISSVGMVDRVCGYSPRNRCFPVDGVCPNESQSILRLDRLALARIRSRPWRSIRIPSLMGVSVFGAHVASPQDERLPCRESFPPCDRLAFRRSLLRFVAGLIGLQAMPGTYAKSSYTIRLTCF